MNIEFFTQEEKVYFHEKGEAPKVYGMEHAHITREIIANVNAFYPDAYEALQQEYSKLGNSLKLYQYRIARRFIACNFGGQDGHSDLQADGQMHLEYVACPLRMECKLAGVVCTPKFASGITDGESPIVHHLAYNYSREEIADKLCLSPHTVNNHIRNAKTRLGFKRETDLVAHVLRRQMYPNKP